MDSFTSSPTSKKHSSMRPKSAAMGASKGGRKGGNSPKKGEGENKKSKRAEINRKVLFQEIKKLLDKAEEVASAPGGSAEVPVVTGAS